MNDVSSQLVMIFFMYLVLSIVFESAFNLIFRWSWFVNHFQGKGIRTLFMIVASILIFWNYELDIVGEVLEVFGHNDGPYFQVGGFVLTALLIAGGSVSVNMIFEKLGWRNYAERLKEIETGIPAKEAKERMEKVIKASNAAIDDSLGKLKGADLGALDPASKKEVEELLDAVGNLRDMQSV